MEDADEYMELEAKAMFLQKEGEVAEEYGNGICLPRWYPSQGRRQVKGRGWSTAPYIGTEPAL